MQVGDIEFQVISGGRFKLDGGGMFGVIPKTLWSRLVTPDDRNRIQMDANCLLVRTGEEVILVDAGYGPKMSDKERAIFDLAPGEELLDNIASHGVRPEDVTTVLLSHLHMDHCGGATRLTGEEVVPAFPRARFVVQRQEWDDAVANRSHMRVSYRMDNLAALEQSGRLQLLDGDAEVATGVRVQVTGGHTRGHHCIFLESGGETAWFAGDICPTPHHFRGPYTMAYDTEPYESMQAKARLLGQAADENWLMIFDHEPDQKVVRVQRVEDGYKATPP
jgi:glyoxylase-like metal-dependent hydrolase (beta-lactamase superfamily II)